MKKNILGGAIAAGMLLASVIPAMAYDQCVNEKTGASSLNTCRIRQAKRVNVTNANTGTVLQNVNTASNTGGNVATLNTAASANDPIMTGEALNVVTSQVGLNKATTGVDQSADAKEVVAGNSITGYASVNRVSINNNKVANVTNSNSGTVTHNVTTNANTGNNVSSMNTISGDIITGHATSDVIVATELNTSTTTIVQ